MTQDYDTNIDWGWTHLPWRWPTAENEDEIDNGMQFLKVMFEAEVEIKYKDADKRKSGKGGAAVENLYKAFPLGEVNSVMY